MRKYILPISLIFIAIQADAQCAMCRAVLESSGEDQTAKGINNGIMYLMIFPYLLVGLVGFWIYKTRRQGEKP